MLENIFVNVIAKPMNSDRQRRYTLNEFKKIATKKELQEIEEAYHAAIKAIFESNNGSHCDFIRTINENLSSAELFEDGGHKIVIVDVSGKNKRKLFSPDYKLYMCRTLNERPFYCIQMEIPTPVYLKGECLYEYTRLVSGNTQSFDELSRDMVKVFEQINAKLCRERSMKEAFENIKSGNLPW